MSFNLHGVWAIYRYEMARAIRTLWQSPLEDIFVSLVQRRGS